MTASLSRAEFTSRKFHNSELASSTIRSWSLGSTARVFSSVALGQGRNYRFIGVSEQMTA